MPAKRKSRKEISPGGVPGRNQPCPCGSGKKYKNCCGQSGSGKSTGYKVLAWVIGVGLAVLLGWTISQSGSEGGSTSLRTSITGYTERDLPEIDFSSLAETAKKTLLTEINQLFCTCGCNLTLAECVVTDSTCPFRNANIQTIRDMVKERSGQSETGVEPSG